MSKSPRPTESGSAQSFSAPVKLSRTQDSPGSRHWLAKSQGAPNKRKAPVRLDSFGPRWRLIEAER